ncbi:autolysin, partial [Streptococcus pneumoniae]|nr:autolysin [Streptococcus pneumoniae]
VVGNGRVMQVGHVNNGSWDVGGGWNVEAYAAVELIESHSTKEEFMMDYRLYIELLRNLADEAGLPKTLDTG